MKRLINLALIGAFCFAGLTYAADTVKIYGLVELSGTGTTSGTNFNNGVKLAVKEINAAGGILGRKIEYIAEDTQSNPGVSKGLAQKAVDEGSYVVMGPVFSGSILVAARRQLSPSKVTPIFSEPPLPSPQRCPRLPTT